MTTPAVIAAGMAKRIIPTSNEVIPVIGLGTYTAFEVGTDDKARAPLQEVLKLFVAAGGALVDSSPMYSSAEVVLGDLVALLNARPALFLATKVWSRGARAGIEQMQQSLHRLHTPYIDLMQGHNLVDFDIHINTLRAWKEQGMIRYIGVSHYTASAYAQVEAVLKNQRLDFLQVNYSIFEPEAEQRLLPLAQEQGVAVIINRPFAQAQLFRLMRNKKLPSWAAELNCSSWGQLFLKFVLSHPAVTCVIPATRDPAHLLDNMCAGLGSLPDARLRQRLVEMVHQ